jgi:hypothetical protein
LEHLSSERGVSHLNPLSEFGHCPSGERVVLNDDGIINAEQAEQEASENAGPVFAGGAVKDHRATTGISDGLNSSTYMHGSIFEHC